MCSPVAGLPRVGDAPVDRRGGDRVGRGQIDLRGRRAHAALEVARGGRDPVTFVASGCRRSRRRCRRHSGAARRRRPAGCLQRAFALRPTSWSRSAGRRDQQRDDRRDLAAAQHRAPPCAGRRAWRRCRRRCRRRRSACRRNSSPAGVGRAVRRGDLRLQRARHRSDGAPVAAHRRRCASARCRPARAGVADEIARGLVGRDQARSAPPSSAVMLTASCAPASAAPDRRAAELDRLVAAAVHAEAADQEQHHVLGDDAGRRSRRRHSHLDGVGHAQPDLAGRRARRASRWRRCRTCRRRRRRRSASGCRRRPRTCRA